MIMKNILVDVYYFIQKRRVLNHFFSLKKMSRLMLKSYQSTYRYIYSRSFLKIRLDPIRLLPNHSRGDLLNEST